MIFSNEIDSVSTVSSIIVNPNASPDATLPTDSQVTEPSGQKKGGLSKAAIGVIVAAVVVVIIIAIIAVIIIKKKSGGGGIFGVKA